MLCIPALVLAACENDKKDKGVLSVDDRVILAAEGGEQRVAVNSNIEWRIECDTEPTSWYKTDIMGAGPSRNYFTITFDENTRETIRTTEIKVFTSDGASSTTVQVIQLSAAPYITPSSESIDVRSRAASYSLGVLTNIPEVEITVSASKTWMKDAVLSDGKLTFRTDANPDRKDRDGTITLAYTDSYDRTVSATITVVQAAQNDSDFAALKDFAYVKAIPAGSTITENIYISGNIVANGQSANFPENRYTIQDAAGNVIVFESANTILLDRCSKASLWMQGGTVKEYSEGTFTYNAITGISAAHIMEAEEDGLFRLPEVFIEDLGNEHVFMGVTLKNVEIASPHGAFTNFKKSIAPGNPNPNYMEKYPEYYRFYPTCVRDIKGDNIYLLTDPGAAFATEALPQGSGKISGIVVREVLTNFDIRENQLCIRPLERGDVALAAGPGESFTEILVEWDCVVPSTSATKVPWTYVAPAIGGTGPVLDKSNATGFSNGRINMTDVYQADDFRGNLANDGRSVNGAYNSLGWGMDVYWYIDKVSTKGISTLLSLQIESNGSWSGGPTDMKVQYAIAAEIGADGITWIDVPDGDYYVLGQFDRASTDGQTARHIPGHKVYDFKLPVALNNQENILLRFIPTSTKGTADTNGLTGGNRLANVSIKYNKTGSGDPSGMIETGGMDDKNLDW